MRISFTDQEIDEILDALESHFCQDSEDSIQTYDKIRKKFLNAQIRSKASKGKIIHIQEAERKKKNLERSKIQTDILKQYHESKRDE